MNSFAIVGDVGGTNCRFARAARGDDGSLSLSNMSKLSVTDFDNFEDALAEYLSGLENPPRFASFALAGPEFDGAIQMTNLGWSVSEADLARRFGFEQVSLANDFAAMARGAAIMPDIHFADIISGDLNYERTVAVLGPGTGLGVAGILPPQISGQPPRILSTEGGFTAFSPRDDLEVEVWQWVMKRFGFVAAEDIVSGPGLLNIYKVLCQMHDQPIKHVAPRDVVAAANANSDKMSLQAVMIFCNALGSFAGNTAHTLGATGGVIITGGVAAHIAPFIKGSNFVDRFKSRGRSSWFTQNIPVRLLIAEATALYGAAALIEGQST